ncbi:hypothetical protein RF11_01912 [Thelohanellus kitauei]|uniref:Uncharacterized protein n=1 Tax=Thelohanellus kitauei TaxID=669202 RepID=A0A0C2MHS8_THEKT|nr:hypothetical protein RF11_01912 [Thelohanellus kitauei]
MELNKTLEAMRDESIGNECLVMWHDRAPTAMRRWHIDLIWLLSLTTTEIAKYMFFDNIFKWPEEIPIQNQTAEIAANALFSLTISRVVAPSSANHPIYEIADVFCRNGGVTRKVNHNLRYNYRNHVKEPKVQFNKPYATEDQFRTAGSRFLNSSNNLDGRKTKQDQEYFKTSMIKLFLDKQSRLKLGASNVAADIEYANASLYSENSDTENLSMPNSIFTKFSRISGIAEKIINQAKIITRTNNIRISDQLQIKEYSNKASIVVRRMFIVLECSHPLDKIKDFEDWTKYHFICNEHLYPNNLEFSER